MCLTRSDQTVIAFEDVTLKVLPSSVQVICGSEPGTDRVCRAHTSSLCTYCLFIVSCLFGKCVFFPFPIVIPFGEFYTVWGLTFIFLFSKVKKKREQFLTSWNTWNYKHASARRRASNQWNKAAVICSMLPIRFPYKTKNNYWQPEDLPAYSCTVTTCGWTSLTTLKWSGGGWALADGMGQSDPEDQHPPHIGQKAVKAACSSPIRGTEKRRGEEKGSIVVTLVRSAEPTACWETLSIPSVGESDSGGDRHHRKFFFFDHKVSATKTLKSEIHLDFELRNR